MSSTVFFYLFIPLLAIILLSVNLIFAPHNPYMEKNSVFECGFSSFLGQNRTQFSISFFIFALLFLLFDLEILLVYPYLVSAYTNGIYGLTILLLFLLALTLGFAFELGKKALSIDSRQISNASTIKTKYAFKLANNTPLSFNMKRYYSTNSDVEFGSIISIISFIRSLVYLGKYIKYLIVSPLNIIRDTFYNLVLDTMFHAIDSNLSYQYFKAIYDAKGLFALLLALVDNIYDNTLNLNISYLLCFYFICYISMNNIDYYLYSSVLLISTVLLLPFIIVTLLKHTWIRYNESHMLESTVSGFLCLILIVLFIYLLSPIMGILKDLLEFFLLTKGINSGGNNSGGPGTGPGPGSGPNPRPEAGPIANYSPRKRGSTQPIDSDSDSDTPYYPDGSPEQNRIDEELLKNAATEEQQVSDEASDEDTDFPNVESPDVQLRRDEDWKLKGCVHVHPEVYAAAQHRENLRKEAEVIAELKAAEKREKTSNKNSRHRALRTDQMISDDAHSSRLARTGQLPPKPSKSSPSGYMAVACGLHLHANSPVEDVCTSESIRSLHLHRVSHLPSVPTHEPVLFPSVPTHEPGLPGVPTPSASIPGSSLEVPTTNIDLLAVSKEFAVKSDLIKRKLIKNKWAKDDVEVIESDKSSVTESTDLSWLDNFFSYLTDSSEKYLSLLNDFVSNNQLFMLAIITLASLVTIFTFLYKIVKTLVKFVKFIFKTISRGINKRNKKTNSSIMKTLLKVYLTSIQISKALSSPHTNKNVQGQSEITWTTPQHISNPQLNQAQYPEIKWAAHRSVPTDLFIDSSQATSNQYTSNAGSSHTIGTSNPQDYTAQTNVKPGITGSIEWQAFCMESLHLLTTDMYPTHVNPKDTITIGNKLLSSLQDNSNYNKSIGEVFDKQDLQILFKQFPIKQNESMYSEPRFLEFAIHALHVMAKSLTFDINLSDSLWLQGPDRDSVEYNSSEIFFGCGSAMYNLKLYIEQASNIEHQINTTDVGNYPNTVLRAHDKCGVSFKDLENSDLMRAILRDHPEILSKFSKFLLEVSDTNFVTNILKSSGGDALRIINFLLVTAESVRAGHNRRCHYHVKLKEFFDQRNIDTRVTAPLSAYHVENKNNGVETKVFTRGIGVNILYRELRCYLWEQENICNQRLRSNPGNTTQHVKPTILGEVHISNHYDMLLKEFFKKNLHFIPPNCYVALTGNIFYDTVTINSELLKAIDDFSF